MFQQLSPRYLLAGIALALCSLPILAQNEFDLSSLERGQIMLNLSINEQTEVDQDLLTAVVQYSVRGRDKTSLQNEVNGAIREALALLEDSENLEYSTQQYHVYIIQPARGVQDDELEAPTWQAQQSIRLSSMDSGELLEMTGELQSAGLHITNLAYSLSPEKYQSVSDSLLTSALENLQQRADDAARAMNRDSAELIEISLDNSHNVFQSREGMMAMAADRAQIEPPVAEPGKTTVSLSVSARALLSPPTSSD